MPWKVLTSYSFGKFWMKSTRRASNNWIIIVNLLAFILDLKTRTSEKFFRAVMNALEILPQKNLDCIKIWKPWHFKPYNTRSSCGLWCYIYASHSMKRGIKKANTCINVGILNWHISSEWKVERICRPHFSRT
mgnify:FL=1